MNVRLLTINIKRKEIYQIDYVSLFCFVMVLHVKNVEEVL